jgi:hypothetical protein
MNIDAPKSIVPLRFSVVIPGLVPGIHVDGRDKPGHDELKVDRPAG